MLCRWRQCEVRAEDYAFVVLSRFVNSLSNYVSCTDSRWNASRLRACLHACMLVVPLLCQVPGG